MAMGIFAASGPDGQNVITLTVCFNWSSGACQDGGNTASHRAYTIDLDSLGGSSPAHRAAALARALQLAFIFARRDGPAAPVAGQSASDAVAALVGAESAL